MRVYRAVERCYVLARVLALVKLYPSGTEVNLARLVEEVRSRLPEGYEITRHEEEPIAFGLKALKLYVLMPEEEEGGTAKLEEILRSVEGVDEVEIEAVHRISEF
jgi:elongation factor 1-beta